jgi:hypothetical protein
VCGKANRLKYKAAQSARASLQTGRRSGNCTEDGGRTHTRPANTLFERV